MRTCADLNRAELAPIVDMFIDSVLCMHHSFLFEKMRTCAALNVAELAPLLTEAYHVLKQIANCAVSYHMDEYGLDSTIWTAELGYL